jgi:hypothetical protein
MSNKILKITSFNNNKYTDEKCKSFLRKVIYLYIIYINFFMKTYNSYTINYENKTCQSCNDNLLNNDNIENLNNAQIENPSNNIIKSNEPQAATCYLIQTEAYLHNNRFMGDGIINFYQDSKSEDVKYDVEVYSNKISEVHVFSNNEIFSNYDYDYRKINYSQLGENIVKLKLDNKRLTDEKNFIVTNSGIIDNSKFSLFNDQITNYSCVVMLKSDNNESSSDNNNLDVIGVGRLQRYDIEQSTIFGKYCLLLNMFIVLVYIYFQGL